jgi:hypothetical protein
MAASRSANGRRRTGQTLLELVGATTIVATALVPALRIMGDCIRVGRETEIANLLATYSVSKLEEHLVETAVLFDAAADEANEVPGYPGIRFRVEKEDEGVGSGLMQITSTVWQDLDGDEVWDAGEPRSVFATKLARNASYRLEANGE